MRRVWVSAGLILLTAFPFFGNIRTSSCQSEYPTNWEVMWEIFWHAEHSRVYILLRYPKEAHRGDVFTFKLEGFWENNKTVDEFDVDLSYHSNGGGYRTLLARNLFSGGVPVKEGDSFDYSFEVEVPMDIPTNDPYNMLLNISIRTDGSNLTEDLELYPTQIVSKTRTELQSENSELSHNYTSLKQSYDDYAQTHSFSNSEYNSLNSTYNDLKSKYQEVGDPVTTRNLMYAFLITTIIFIATTVYFAVRRPK